MKLRRSLALAAATAAIAPVVLLAAPLAYASDGTQAVSASESAPAAEDTTPAAEDTTPAAEDTTPAAEDTTPAAEDTTPAADASQSTSAAPTASASAPASGSAAPSASVSASPSASESTFPTECDGSAEPKFDDDLHTTLSGLPSKVVAGSGYHNFKLNVRNTGAHTYKRVDLGVFAASVSEDDFSDANHLTLEYKDPATGTWTDISLDENDEGAGYLGYTDVQAKESFSIDLRLAVDAKAPEGFGFAISIGMYADDKGDCVYSSDDSYYEFDILKAGTAPGKPGDAKPQGGRKPLPAKPSGNTQISPQGRLAETGASSVLPAIALSGGAAVALGAGAVFVVRRRKAAGSGIVA
ncbi:LPXTG cell wall anchor domain-containing protein [Streptomyces sp. NPDC005435]|uniref:LPXTG cell wall anchor domain-containing protein n=1 Tax=Streptomyces sp. NPDC005435 TaxID=3154464 RepID=UPI0034556B43